MVHDLTRRTFLGSAALVGAVSALGLTPTHDGYESASSDGLPRRSSFDRGWKFFLGDSINAQDPALDDRTWTPLNVPHDWSIAGPYSETAPGGSTGGYLPTGVGWYRKSYWLPHSAAGRRILLEFDGVYQCSDVWLNGHHLGSRPYGFITFCYDLTAYLKYGKETNLIAVRVDNSHQPNLRWYSGSGIYRHTWLINTGLVYIQQWGTGITTPEITDERAIVKVTTRVRNDLKQPAACSLDTVVRDDKGEVIQTVNTEAEIDPGGSISSSSRSRWRTRNSGLPRCRIFIRWVRFCSIVAKVQMKPRPALGFAPWSSTPTRVFF